jgi:amino acid permease
MTFESRAFIKSIQILIGSIIGVGIFGLPFVFAQSGFGIGFIHLVLIGFSSFILVLAYGQIVSHNKDHHRLSGCVKEYLGDGWGRVAGFIHFIGNWGAMLAYIIIGGEFLHAIASPFLNFGVLFYQLLFIVLSAFILIGGLGLVSRIEVFTVFILLVLFAALIIGSSTHIDLDNLLSYDISMSFLPFGVVLFSFGGLGSIPEMKDILGRAKHKMSNVIAIGFCIILIVYLLFSATVVGVTGSSTTEEAILGLGDVVGNWALIIGSVIGLFAVFTCFINLGVQIMDTAIYDYKARYLSAWAIAVLVPFLLFIFGARDFISVIGFTGGVFGVIIGLLVIAMYKKAKRTLPKRTLGIPNLLLNFIVLILVIGMITTILDII